MTYSEIDRINKIFTIDSLDNQMCNWAISYLAKLPFVPPLPKMHPTASYQAIIHTLGSIQNKAEQELVLRKMKAAWNQKIRRENKERKTCSYLLTPQTQEQLALLAASNEQPIYKTLEMIINKAFRVMERKKPQAIEPEAPIANQQFEDLVKDLTRPIPTNGAPGPNITFS